MNHNFRFHMYCFLFLGISAHAMEHATSQIALAAVSKKSLLRSIVEWCVTSALTAASVTAYPNDYSIHLMWINRDYAKDQHYIYPSTVPGTGKTYLNTIFSWAAKNHESTVMVWFDGSLLPSSALVNTQELIKQKSADYSSIAPIEFKDIRDLNRVKKQPELFSAQVPVYFRSDLLRAIVADEQLSNKDTSYFVYADFDVEPLSKAQLFDPRTIKQVNQSGYVMAYEYNQLGFENSFQLLTNRSDFFHAHSLLVIEANIKRAYAFLEDINQKNTKGSLLSNPNVWKLHEISFQENVFYSYVLMHEYVEQCKNKSSATLASYQDQSLYKPDLDELAQTNARLVMAKSTALAYLKKNPIPVKKVSIPQSRSVSVEIHRNNVI